MPEYWEPPVEVQQKTVVPIARAMKIMRSLTIGASMTTRNGVSFFRQPGKFKIMVSSSRARGGDVYLDADILKIVDKNNFEKVSDKMTATLSEEKIEELVNLLQEKFNDSVSLSPGQYEIIKKEITKREIKVNPTMVILPKNSSATIEQLELEAFALELELELLNFAA